MIKRRHVFIVWVVALAACNGNPVGRLCDLGTNMPDPSEVVVASPSLDCVTRECLKVPLTNPTPPKGSMYPTGTNGLCTATCESNDDCNRVPESPCISGFTCGVAVTVGPFCCKKLCICKDYIQIPETGHLATPMACDPTNMANSCCNLAGRVGNAMYPLCK
jgi:hypothetical protein